MVLGINLYQFLFIQEDLVSGKSVGIKSILADALEALIGVVYTEYGFAVTKDFIHKYILEPGLTKVYMSPMKTTKVNSLN